MRTILGIDPGLATTGYGIIRADGQRHVHVCHGVIVTKPENPRSRRLSHLFTELNAVIDRYHPQEAAVETLYFSKNRKTALPVAEARGVILVCLALQDVPCSEYTPLQVKKAVLGRGRAEKRQIQEMIKIIFGLAKIPRPDDAADAIAAAFCHSNNLRRMDHKPGDENGNPDV
jgi:crossover junction endodeoxyribonuclease RuvC